MNLKKRSESRRRGDAMALAVVAVMLLLAVGMGLLGLGLHARVYSFRTTSDITARCAADAGLAMALFKMNEQLKSQPWSDSILPEATTQQLSNCDATFDYKVTSGTDGYVIEAVGNSGICQKRVCATLSLQGLFEHAILTKEILTLKAGTVVDGYNSLDPSDTGSDADVGTQSTSDDTVTLNNGVTVEGDVIVGVGGDPDTVIKDLGATTGDRYAGTQNDPLPAISPPALPNKASDISAKGKTVTLTPADSGKYSAIELKNASAPGVLEITGGAVTLHITGGITLGQSCEIIIRNGASLTIYTDGNILCDNGSDINSENPPEAASTLQLFATGEGTQSFDLKAKSKFTGVIYAPNANVQLNAGGDAYGSIVANSFEFKTGGNYHYDEALRQVETDDQGVRFVVKRWYEGSSE